MPHPMTIIQPQSLANFHEVCCALSTRRGGVRPEPLGINLSFSVGDGPKNVERNRALFFRALDIPEANIAFTRQVHGDTVCEVQHAGTMEKCDALISNKPDLYLAISVADCVPIFLFDPVTKSIGAVHAGWRGSGAGIVTKTIEMMKERYRANAEMMFAYIGPSAGVCCYEVGEDVASAFLPRYLDRSGEPKPHLDLKLVNRDLLLQAGLLSLQIEVSDACTICTEELYHSFRRDGQKSGRMLGVIGLRGKSAD